MFENLGTLIFPSDNLHLICNQVVDPLFNRIVYDKQKKFGNKNKIHINFIIQIRKDNINYGDLSLLLEKVKKKFGNNKIVLNINYRLLNKSIIDFSNQNKLRMKIIFTIDALNEFGLVNSIIHNNNYHPYILFGGIRNIFDPDKIFNIFKNRSITSNIDVILYRLLTEKNNKDLRILTDCILSPLIHSMADNPAKKVRTLQKVLNFLCSETPADNGFSAYAMNNSDAALNAFGLGEKVYIESKEKAFSILLPDSIYELDSCFDTRDYFGLNNFSRKIRCIINKEVLFFPQYPENILTGIDFSDSLISLLRTDSEAFEKCRSLFKAALKNGIPSERNKGSRIFTINIRKNVNKYEYMRVPDFLCIGSQKSATKWLYENLNNHPDIYTIRESHFLDWRYHKGWQYYLNLFSETGAKVIGEVCPEYCLMPNDRIAMLSKINPGMKIIYILRNPIERSWSHAYMNLVVMRKKDFSDVDPGDFYAHFTSKGSILRNSYRKILNNWMKFNNPENIFVSFYDAIKTQPMDFLHSIFTFLDVSLNVKWEDFPIFKKVNKGASIKMPEEFRQFLKRLYFEDIRYIQKKILKTPLNWLE